MEPLAKGYNKLPDPLKKGTNNFTSNIGTLLSIPNNILQGNLKQLGHSVDFWVDGGLTKGGLPSTLGDASEPDFRIIREGAVPSETIKPFL